MKKLKLFAVLGILMFGMSSCVYSLFPIYTEETLVFLPELVGKWQTEPGDYIIFEPMTDNRKIEMGLMEAPKPQDKLTFGQLTINEPLEINDDSDGDLSTYNYTMSGNGWRIKSDDPIKVELENGKVITDPDEVRAYYDAEFGDIQFEADNAGKRISDKMAQATDSLKNGNSELGNKLEKFGESMEKLSEGLGKLGQAVKKVEAEIKGTAYVSTDDTYKMEVIDGEDRTVYQAHLAQIGEDYFLDVYPLAEYSNEVFTNNLFPVHSFFKVEVERGQLKLTSFDLEKLNELFESNLIRLRHEYVDGNVLITAQPKEIQKFLDKYSDDETVFEEETVYARID